MWLRHKTDNDSDGNIFWITMTDLMTGLVLVFVVMFFYTYLNSHQEKMTQIIAQENATIDTLTIKTANSGYFSKVENLYAIIHEEQEDGTKKEIASMETPVNLSSSNTQYKLTFYPFAITKDKKYFVEFI